MTAFFTGFAVGIASVVFVTLAVAAFLDEEIDLDPPPGPDLRKRR